mgnify:CR=1 FL=1
MIMTKRFYQQYLDMNTGEYVIFDNDSYDSSGAITLSGNTVYTIEHNKNTIAVLCYVFDSTNSPVIPDKIKIVDLNTIEITVTTIEEIKVLILL